MTHVATLVSASLNAEMLAKACSLLPHSEAPVTLSLHHAYDIPFIAENEKQHEAALRAFFKGDICVQPVAYRRKKLLVADMDSTMIEQECIDELADFVGKKAFVSEITERAMRGELAFEPALRERVALLKGLPLSVIDEVIRDKITLMAGGKTLIATMKANGAYCALVSGGFTAFTAKIAAILGFDENRGNILLHEKGCLTGLVQAPILGKEAKRAALLELSANLHPQETLALGDGANDLDMITVAGLGVAYHAKPKVAEAAKARIDHGDLTSLLFFQGFTQKEWVLS
jgi:phosphoserine phosphatase